jgi:UDP-N-acetylglucosamine 1-carboxyvinyltransferase
MNTTNHKIGQLICQIRQDRGMTQAEFARKLKTSQSAVNRIEHGNQNLSLETLGRISDVLKKPLISISGSALNLRIKGGQELSGSIDVKTSKNAAVALLMAALLNKGTTRLRKMPRIEEVNRLVEVLQSIGVQLKWHAGNDLEIKPPAELDLSKINATAARKTRSVIMLFGPLVHMFDNFKIPYAGGCKLGTRSVKAHAAAFEEIGVSIVAKTGHYAVNTLKKAASEVVMYETSDTATENILMAAARFEETTIIHLASANYMVQDLCLFLKKLGVKINGIGTSTLEVTGVKDIKKNVSYSPSEDPIEAMTFIAAAVITDSKITVKRSPIEFLRLELLKLKYMGLKYDVSEEYKADNNYTKLVDITIHKHNGKLKSLDDKVHANPHPGINIDNLPLFGAIAATTKGRTLIHDWFYEDRAIYFTELRKLGASVSLVDPHRVYIDGPTKWNAADITCPPALRPAMIILLGMLAAPGTSTLRNIYSINRGYEGFAERLASIGANIEVVQDF